MTTLTYVCLTKAVSGVQQNSGTRYLKLLSWMSLSCKDSLILFWNLNCTGFQWSTVFCLIVPTTETDKINVSSYLKSKKKNTNAICKRIAYVDHFTQPLTDRVIGCDWLVLLHALLPLSLIHVLFCLWFLGQCFLCMQMTCSFYAKLQSVGETIFTSYWHLHNSIGR
jgi:hypothetical protein